MEQAAPLFVNRCGYLVATVLTVYGIETGVLSMVKDIGAIVATVLTVYGIETHVFNVFHF